MIYTQHNIDMNKILPLYTKSNNPLVFVLANYILQRSICTSRLRGTQDKTHKDIYFLAQPLG